MLVSVVPGEEDLFPGGIELSQNHKKVQIIAFGGADPELQAACCQSVQPPARIGKKKLLFPFRLAGRYCTLPSEATGSFCRLPVFAQR